MKISLNWLNQLLHTQLDPEQTAETLTGTGLEVEGMEPFESVPGGLQGLVTGEVLTCIKHPNADKLSLTTVDTGDGKPRQIVCGAPNVAAGQKVIVALPGTTLYPLNGEPFRIKESKIRGELSQGMICAEDEIGLGESHQGIIVLDAGTPAGKPASQLYNIESDTILEIGLTPNRSDAISHFGVARDLAAALQLKGENIAPVFPPAATLKPAENPTIPVTIHDTEKCLRYSGMFISQVKTGPSPDWLKNRLTATGLRPVNNIVDITNFVMLELGQPLHAFDADRIKGKQVHVRTFPEGTGFTTLDGKERTLGAGDLMIADDSSPMTMAGIFGGLDSGVTENTTSVFLESACFNPVAIRKSAKHHALRTDSSFRFERATDPEATLHALSRAAQLISELAGGDISEGYVDIYPEPATPVKVNFRPSAFARISGTDMPEALMKQIITALGMEITKENADQWEIRVPGFKADVTREIDIIEELLRIYGYDQVPARDSLAVPVKGLNPHYPSKARKAVSHYLAACGFTEIMNNSLTASSAYEKHEGQVKVLNPLSSDLDILRPDMILPALQTIRHNMNRQQHDLKLMEFGFVYSKHGDKFHEEEQLALFSTGKKSPLSWTGGDEDAGYYFMKGVTEGVLSTGGLDQVTSRPCETEGFSWGIRYEHKKKWLAVTGRVHDKLTVSADIDAEVYVTLLNWKTFCELASAQQPAYREVPRFPFVRRDLALLVDSHVPYAVLEEVAKKHGGKLLKETRLFDVYEGKNLPEGKRSLAMSFMLQDAGKTLTDQEVEKVMDKLKKAFEEEAAATLR